MVSQTFDALINRSSRLPYSFPRGPENRLAHVCRTEADQQRVASFANGTRPITHQRVLDMAQAFVEVKQSTGSSVERELYGSIDRCGLFDRLLKCRPLVFYGPADSWQLGSGESGVGGFEQIGTDRENSPLNLATLLSYDEVALSALVGVSTPTLFINDGDRHNEGRPGPPGSYQREGVYIGLVGARFERRGEMEWRHMMVTSEQNTTKNGYGRDSYDEFPLLAAWAKFYEQENGFPLFDDVAAGRYPDSSFLKIREHGYLNTDVYRRRIRAVIEPFLFEAAERARDVGRRAYVHAVGLGLGVWGVHSDQGQLMCHEYGKVLSEHSELTETISDLDFSWFPPDCNCRGRFDSDDFNGVRVHYSRRNPAAPLDDAEKLLVAMYAWDGNSWPGNEYWVGSLTDSGDPAAACCSLIAELQNPDVNHMISGQNLVTYPPRGTNPRSTRP